MQAADIRQKREKMGLSLRAFAQLAKMSPAYLSRIEKGEVVPQQRTLDKIIKVFALQDRGVSIANYYVQPSVAAENKGKAVAQFIYLIDRVLYEAGEKKEKEIIAAVLGFMETLEIVALSTPVNDSEMVGALVEAYYTYLKQERQKEQEEKVED